MSEVKRSDWSRTDYIRSDSPLSGTMTVGNLREFVHTLDNHGVPDATTLTDHRAHDSLHLIALSVRVDFTVSLSKNPRTKR